LAIRNLRIALVVLECLDGAASRWPRCSPRAVRPRLLARRAFGHGRHGCYRRGVDLGPVAVLAEDLGYEFVILVKLRLLLAQIVDAIRLGAAAGPGHIDLRGAARPQSLHGACYAVQPRQ